MKLARDSLGFLALPDLGDHVEHELGVRAEDLRLGGLVQAAGRSDRVVLLQVRDLLQGLRHLPTPQARGATGARGKQRASKLGR